MEGLNVPSGVFTCELFLASSGSTLGHGPTTRTHACRRPPKRDRGRPMHTHTHTIYAVRRVYSAGAHPVASPPSPVSHRLASASLAVSEPNPSNPTPPHLPFPRVSLHKRHSREQSPFTQVQQIHCFDGGKQSFQPASVSLLSESHSMGEPAGTIPSGPSVPQ